MELAINLGFGELLNLINQLPANQIAKIKNEFPEHYIAEKAKTEIINFQKFILTGPVMTDEQYAGFKQRREHFNTWRIG